MTKEQNKIGIKILDTALENLDKTMDELDKVLKELIQRKKDQRKIAIRELEGIKEFLEKRIKEIKKDFKFDEIPDSASAESPSVEKIYSIEPIMPSVCEELNEIVKGQLEEILRLNQENDKLRKENAELKERLEEALTGGSARKPRKNPDEEYTAHIQQEVAAAEVVKASEEKAEATPSEVPEENKYINYNFDREAWYKRNDENIKRLKELQEANDFGAEYDDLLFKTMITRPDNENETICSMITTCDAIYKLNIIEDLFRDHHIDSLKDLENLLNFAN